MPDNPEISDQTLSDPVKLAMEKGLAEQLHEALHTARHVLKRHPQNVAALGGLIMPREDLATLFRAAARYGWLRSRDLETIHEGGIFIGQIPENLVLSGSDADLKIDAFIAAEAEEAEEAADAKG